MMIMESSINDILVSSLGKLTSIRDAKMLMSCLFRCDTADAFRTYSVYKTKSVQWQLRQSLYNCYIMKDRI